MIFESNFNKSFIRGCLGPNNVSLNKKTSLTSFLNYSYIKKEYNIFFLINIFLDILPFFNNDIGYSGYTVDTLTTILYFYYNFSVLSS